MTHPREATIIKLSRQIAKDMQKLAKLDQARASIQGDITRAERLLGDIKRKLVTG